MRYNINAEVYILQHRYEKKGDWVDSAYWVNIPEYNECLDGWQKYGIECWENSAPAFTYLSAIMKKYPQHLFRMALVHIEKRVIGTVEINQFYDKGE